MTYTIGYNELAERYIASWNETDAEARQKLVRELWAEDGTYNNRFFAVTGIQALDFVTANAVAEYGSKGFVFRSQNDAYGHHGGVHFHWVMVATATGEVDTWGEDFLVLNPEGKIVSAHQFAMRRPSI